MSVGLPGDQVAAFVLLDLALIIAVARLVGGWFARVGQPRVVGEIVAGVLLGPSVLGPHWFVWHGAPAVLACDRSVAASGATPSISTCLFPAQAMPTLGLIGQLALALFIFLVGLELDLAQLRGRFAAVIGVAVGVVAVPVVGAFALEPLLYRRAFVAGYATDAAPSRLAFTLLIAAMLAVTAFPVAARIMQEKGLDRSTLGAITIVSAGLVTILMFLVLGVARGVASGGGVAPQLSRLAGVTAYLVAMFAVVRPLLARLAARRPSSSAGDDLAAAFVVAVASAYVTDRLGLHAMVGGFVAGVVLPRREQLRPILTERLGDVTTAVLLPVFMAYSGLQTDFTTLSAAALGGLAAFLLVGIATKWSGGVLAGRMAGLTWHEANIVGVLMNCRGLLVLVVGLIGIETGVITSSMQVGGVLMALVTTAMTGPLVDGSLRLARMDVAQHR